MNEFKSFLLVMILAFGLRFAGITFDSLWLDESYQTLADATGQPLPEFKTNGQHAFIFRFEKPQSIEQVFSNFRQVDPLCPPLYSLLLNRWMSAFGNSDLTIRLLSTLFSLSAIPITYFFARWLLGVKAAIFASLIQAISPFEIAYAQEARMYTLVELTATISCVTLLWLTKVRTTGLQLAIGWLTYIVSTWALINSHYTALFVVLFQGIYCTFHLLRRGFYRLYFCITLAWIGVAALWLPWFDYFRQAASIRTASFYVARNPSLWWPIWAIIARLPFNWMVFLSGKKVVAYAVSLYFTALFMILAALFATTHNQTESRASQSTVKFLWCWALIPAIAIWFADILEGHKVIEISRYLIATAPAIYILAGFGLSSLWALTQQVEGAKQISKRQNLTEPFSSFFHSRFFVPSLIFVHASFALINNAYAHYVPQREPWKEMAAKVESLSRPDDLILVSQYYDIVCLDRYLTVPRRQLGVSPSQGAQHVEKILLTEKRFWLVTAQEGDKIKNLIPTRFTIYHQLDLGHSLHLTLYEEH